MPQSLLGMEVSDLTEALGPAQPKYRARQIYDAVYQQRVADLGDISTLPKALRVEEALARVPFKVSFSSYPDETTSLCDLILPDDHPLESWGDAEASPGMLSLQQPVMERVFDTRTTADVLMLVTKGDPATAGRYPMADYRAWLTGRFPGGATALGTALARGVVSGTPLQRPAPARPASAPPTAAPPTV